MTIDRRTGAAGGFQLLDDGDGFFDDGVIGAVDFHPSVARSDFHAGALFEEFQTRHVPADEREEKLGSFEFESDDRHEQKWEMEAAAGWRQPQIMAVRYFFSGAGWPGIA